MNCIVCTKIPRLHKDAIPSQFPWTKETGEKKINIQEEKRSEIEETSNIEILDNGKNILTSLSFNNIINIVDNKYLHMPQWTHMKYFNENMKLLIFHLPMVNAIQNFENGCNISLQKEVILKENMVLKINILKQSIINISFDVPIY